MQSNYETADQTDQYHHPESHQHFPDTDSCSPPFFSHAQVSPIINIPSTQTNHRSSLLHHQQDLLNITNQQNNSYSNILQQHQNTPMFTHQFFQQWPQIPPWQVPHGRREEHQMINIPAQSSHCNNNYLFPVNFKLGGDYLLDGNHGIALPENRPCSSLEFTPKFCRQMQEYSTAKQPFCKDIHIPNADKKNSQFTDVREMCNELEEIYGLVKNSTPTTTAETNYNQLTGSGSALTGENSPAADQANVDPALFCEEETDPPRKLHKKMKKSSSKEMFRSMAGFLENLVEQVMSHQDKLHSIFLESIERIDRQRREREEEWRRQEVETQNREAIARLHEQDLASSREALIISYLEKITGQKVDLPPRNENHLSLQPDLITTELSNLEEMTHISKSTMKKRWPKSEVEALIRARSGLESKFQEPELIEGPTWEEVSAVMAAMGYRRSAKRCKEKWENINKCFKKTKDINSATKGSLESKPCSYFDRLDQPYSGNTTLPIFNNGPSSSSSSSHCSKPLVDGFGAQRQSYIELLEALTTKRVGGVAKSSSSGKLDFDGIFHDRVEFELLGHEKEKLIHHGHDKVFEDEIEEEEEEEKDLDDDE